MTREFERIATREQKLALLECLFAVTAVDDVITSADDDVVKQIASELKLSHAESYLRTLPLPRSPGRFKVRQNHLIAASLSRFTRNE